MVQSIWKAFWGIWILGVRAPILLVAIVVLVGGLYGISMVSHTATILLGGILILGILLGSSGRVSSWRHAGRRSSAHPHEPLYSRNEERAIVNAQLEADRTQDITRI